MSSITLPLPYQILDGQLADAVPVMGNFNYIAAQVNAAIAPAQASWTPSLLINGVNTGITYAAQAGSYYQIGSTVFFYGYIGLTSKGAQTGAVRLTSLPVPINAGFASTMNNVPIGNININSGALFTFSWAQLSLINPTQILIVRNFPSAANSELQNTDILNGTALYFSGSYPT